MPASYDAYGANGAPGPAMERLLATSLLPTIPVKTQLYHTQHTNARYLCYWPASDKLSGDTTRCLERWGMLLPCKFPGSAAVDSMQQQARKR